MLFILISALDSIAAKSDTCAIMQNVKIALEQILQDRKKSMYALAKEEKISYSTVHKMATKDLQSIDLSILQKICNNLKCTPNDLLPMAK